MVSLSARLLKQKETAHTEALDKNTVDSAACGVDGETREQHAVDYDALAEKTESFTCTDLENMVRSAGRKAIMDNAQAVTGEHFEQALCEVQKIVKEREEKSSLNHYYI